MALSPIQPKKQGNRKSSEARGWRQQGKGGGVEQNLKKGGREVGRQYRGGGLCKIGGRTPLPTMLMLVSKSALLKKEADIMILIIKTAKYRRDIIVTELTVIKNSSKLRRLSETNEVNSFKSWYHHNKPTEFLGYRTSAGFEYSFMLKSK